MKLVDDTGRFLSLQYKTFRLQPLKPKSSLKLATIIALSASPPRCHHLCQTSKTTSQPLRPSSSFAKSSPFATIVNQITHTEITKQRNPCGHLHYAIAYSVDWGKCF